jgi:hypothetical protein
VPSNTTPKEKEEEIKDSTTKGTIWSHRLWEDKTCQRLSLLSWEDDLGIVLNRKQNASSVTS